MTEAYTLTHQQLIEVAVQFSIIMGWMGGPSMEREESLCEIGGALIPE
jgi:hypothetical protein